MPTVLTSRRVAAVLAALLLALVTACGGSPADPATSPGPEGGGSSSADAGDVFPVTLTHALGTITIPEKPQRIITLGEDLDTLAALGITPVGYLPIAPGYTDDVPYHQGLIDLSESEVLTGSSPDEWSMEQMAALDPDLILASNTFGIDQVYEQLSKIAPVLAYEEAWGETSWQDMSRTVGIAVGEPAEAEAAVAKTEQYLADLKAELPGLEGKTVASAYYHTAGTFASNPRSASMDKYLALGMEISEELANATTESDNSISLENIDVLDADLLLLSFGSPALQEELTSSSIYQGLHAVQAGAVHLNDPSDSLPTFAGNNPSLLNIPWVLEQGREALEAAAQQ